MYSKIIILFYFFLINTGAIAQADSTTRALIKEHKERVKLINDQGIHHDFHKENIGEIIFSDREIGIKTQSNTHIKQDFLQLSNGIYGQVFLSHSLKNSRLRMGFPQYEKGYSIQYYIDGILIYTVHHRHLSIEEDEKWTSWQVIPAPSIKDEYHSKITYAFAEVLMRIRPGKRHFKIVLLAINDPLNQIRKPVAEGEFTLTFSDEDRKAFVARYERTHQSIKQ